MTSVSLLPEISFAPQDLAQVEAEILATYERLSGLTLQPGDPVRLFLESLAYLIGVQNNLIDLAGKQNLLAFATGAHLDHLGVLMGVSRIPAQNSICLLRFAIDEVLAFPLPIPEGTRVASQDGSIVFATISGGEIAAGELATDVLARSTTAGANTAGLLEQQINRLVDPLPYVTSAYNVTVTSEGADVEDDERLRERIRVAPESFTVAGSVGAYEARTLAVSQDIEEVSVHSPAPGDVDVRFTVTGGELPDEAMIELVQSGLSAETVRPLTDTVYVAAPEVVPYDIKGKWYLRRSDAVSLGAITQAVADALEEYRVWQRRKPGRDINPTKLIATIERAGAKRVELESPVFTPLRLIEVAREGSVEMLFGGLEDD